MECFSSLMAGYLPGSLPIFNRGGTGHSKGQQRMLRKFRKKPVVIEAMQFDENNGDEVMDWVNSHFEGSIIATYPQHCAEICISTLEGNVFAQYGDWIIKGVQGEFYPCKPDIFEATYEEVTS